MHSYHRQQRGFTLTELMICIAVLAVLMALAVPTFKNASLPSKLRSEANSLTGDARLARSEAIKRNTTVTLCVSADGKTCGTGNWSQGWIVVAPGLASPLQSEPPAPTGYHITPAGGSNALIFQASGTGATTETFTVCRATPTGSQERSVTISAVGRPSVRTTTNGVCP